MTPLIDHPESELGAVDNGLDSRPGVKVCKEGIIVHGVLFKPEVQADIFKYSGRRVESLSFAEAHAIGDRVRKGGPLFPDRNPEIPGDIMDMLHLDHKEEITQNGGHAARTHCERLAAEREAPASLYDGIPNKN